MNIDSLIGQKDLWSIERSDRKYWSGLNVVLEIELLALQSIEIQVFIFIQINNNKYKNSLNGLRDISGLNRPTSETQVVFFNNY